VHKIRWKSDIGGHVKIELNGVIIPGMDNLINNGEIDWTIEQAVGDNNKIKITSIESPAIFDESDNDFSISNIELLEPNDGENWVKGHQHKIKWVGAFANNVDIILRHQKSDGTWSPEQNIALNHANNMNIINELDWNTNVNISKQYKVLIRNHDDNTIEDESDDFFEVNLIEVISPNIGNEIWWSGNSYNITWQDEFAENVKINLLKGVDFYDVIFPDTDSDGIENWTIPPPPVGKIPEPGNDYRIQIVSADNNTIIDESDNDFTIISTILTNPQGGQLYFPGDVIEITWKSNQPGPVDIEIYDEFDNLIILIPFVPNNLIPLTNSYLFSIPGGFLGTYKVKIRCVINPATYDEREFEVTDVILADWIGVISDDWDDPGNWSNSLIPDVSTDVTILPGVPNEPVIYNIANTNILTLEPGVNLTISSTGDLTTHGLLTCDGQFIIESDIANGYAGSYIDIGGITGTGSVNFTRNMICTGSNPSDPYDPTGWHYLSAPIDGLSTDNLLDYFVNQWNETTSSWINYSGEFPCTPYTPAEYLDPMEVWSLNYDSEYNCTGGTGFDIEFEGLPTSLHTGPYSTPITFNSGAYAGWNLVGNPYPSGIDMSLISWDPNVVQGAAYYDGCAGNYVYWSSAMGPYVMSPTLGFFVEATAPGTFSLTGAERAHSPDWFWKSDPSNLLSIQADGEEKTDLTHILFSEQASNGFDRTGDFHKLISTTEGLPQIYTTIGDEKLAINSLPSTDKIPMEFTASTSGQYTLSAIETSDITTIYLEDRNTGSMTDMLKDSYTFSYQQGDAADRFTLHFGEVNQESDDGFIIYSKQDNIVLFNNLNQKGEVAIYNLLGQQIVSQSLQEGLNNIHVNGNCSYYIVNVKTAENVINKKLYIH